VARVPRGTTNPVEIDLRSPVRSVRLEVEVDGSHPSYAVRIQTANGDVVWHDDDMPAPNPGEPLLVSVPADAFAAGDSLLAVNGEALRGRRFSVRYGLRVVR
jgi:hypothetical protein